jgi:hypothetical protein
MLRGISASYIGDELSLLTDKITSILKRHVVEEGIIDDSVSIQQVAHVPPPEEVFRNMLDGCLRRKRLAFSYCSPASGQQTIREVDPTTCFTTWAHGTLPATAICEEDFVISISLAYGILLSCLSLLSPGTTSAFSAISIPPLAFTKARTEAR